jgi:hypothetical protein
MASTARQSLADKRRSDYGSYEYSERDERLQLIVAQQTFISLDHLADFADHPLLRPAIDEPRDDKTKSKGKQPRGGKRDDVGWPLDRRKRLHALAEIVRRWERKQGYVETWKPWEHEPAWVRMNEAGLRNLGLPWNEIVFPEKRKRLLSRGHPYQVNKRRLALARGSADAPKHTWLCERAIFYEQLQRDPNMIRAHRPDGVLQLKADGSFPFKRGETVIEQIPLKAGQRVAVEVELSRKGFARLGNGILPSLLRNYDYAWYFCGNQEVYQTVIAARRDYLSTNEERKRIRILLLEEKIEEEEDEDE